MPKRDADHMMAQRERILRATIHCISALGLERTSIVEICKKAELSAGALYTHFASKEEIVAEALRFGGATENAMPGDWPSLTAWIADTSDHDEFAFATIARTQLQVVASSARPGALHEVLKPMIEASLTEVVRHLTQMERSGRVKLRLSPLRTALAIHALKDGMSGLALARDRPLSEMAADLAAALDCLIVGE